ncbi:unannotated protein [freshwater metagenome]|jgi:uncharacterized membrane protein YqgA involved in biofilm formation|uniref:Unannotated protein n=1 Tax=freshwater metagenome TaxID=449393 RepID=A0A6J7RQC4_9ZZZZ|nr:DUF554 family protein [Actinomycetota bacterium]MTH94196.1 DUF554 family protein [Actinomycetota bacterium]
MRGIGTLTNVFTIVGGTLLGLIVGRYISERIRLTVEQAVGMTTLVLGIATAAKTDNIVFPLVSVVLGGIIGESLRIEDRFESLGNWVRRKVEVKTQTGWLSRTSLTTLHPRFVEGFVTATLLFSIGPMSILGSIDDGLGRGAQILIVKAALDGLVSILFAATMGWGVAISAVIVGIYQGLMTLGASGLDAILTDRMVHEMSATGGIMILGIALRFMEVKPIRVGSLLPGLFVAPVLVALFAR